MKPERAQMYLDELKHCSPQITARAESVQEFRRNLWKRNLTTLPKWKRNAGVCFLAGFAKYPRREESAFLATLQSPRSNRPVEENLDLLKFAKRAMYGRASFGRLRCRLSMPCI